MLTTAQTKILNPPGKNMTVSERRIHLKNNISLKETFLMVKSVDLFRILQPRIDIVTVVTCNRLVNLGISKTTTLVFENKEFNLKNTNLTKRKRLRYVTLTGLIWVQCVPAS